MTEGPAHVTPVDIPDAPDHQPSPAHIVVIEGPDAAGHWEWRCTLGDAEATGYEPHEVLAEAELHGPLAADQGSTLDELAAAIAADEDEDEDAW